MEPILVFYPRKCKLMRVDTKLQYVTYPFPVGGFCSHQVRLLRAVFFTKMH